jgi:hypothetical protein
MEFAVLTVARKKKTKVEIHTPSCGRVESLKKRGSVLRKVQAQYVEDAKALVVGTAPIAVHDRCCKLFHKPVNTNPSCPHCQSASTVFASNIGVGKKQFSCTACKRLFVVAKPSRESGMKIKIHKSSASKVRAEKRAVRLAERDARRAERKAKRIVRIGIRLRKIAARLEKMEVGALNLVLFADSIAPVAKAAKKKVARKGRPARKTATAPVARKGKGGRRAAGGPAPKAKGKAGNRVAKKPAAPAAPIAPVARKGKGRTARPATGAAAAAAKLAAGMAGTNGQAASA